VRISDDDQGLGAEITKGVLASVVDEGSGQSPAAGRGMGADVLVPGDPVGPGNHAQLGDQLPVQECSEPCSVAGFSETAPGAVPGIGERMAGGDAVLGITHPLERRRLLPVAISGQLPDGGGLVGMRWLAEHLGGQDGVTLDVQSSCGKAGQVNAG